MFKKCAAKPERPGRKIRKSIISNVALAIAVSTSILLALATAYAMPASSDTCYKKYNACNSRCLAKYSGLIGKPGYTDKVTSCVNRTCQKQYDNCLKYIGSGGSKAETPPDPIHPKGGNPCTPPTGGAMDEPKAPPKVNDTRPPMGGGVFHPKTSGGGNDGPILHSGGSPGPILKSNGGSGPSFKSGDRH